MNKRIRSIPCRYRAQLKSWILSELFAEWIEEIDRKFSVQKRKVALIIDNCPTHQSMQNLNLVELSFFLQIQPRSSNQCIMELSDLLKPSIDHLQ